MTTCINDRNLASVRESLLFICKHLTAAPKARLSSDIKAAAARLGNIIFHDQNAIERFYFIQLLCQLLSNEKPNKVDRVMKVVLPTTQSAQYVALVSDIINFALCHPSSHVVILDHLSSQLSSCDLMKIDIESWHQAASLALESPSFCSALLSRSDLNQMGIDKKLLAKWLQDLSKTEQEFPPVNLIHIITNSLLNELVLNDEKESSQHNKEKAITATLESDLHFSILTLIQSRRCQVITQQFLIALSNQLRELLGKPGNESFDSTMVLDRFGQILSVAAACKVTTITSSLKIALRSLESNQLIAGLITWQDK